MMSFAFYFVRSPKEFKAHLCQKVPFVLACFHVSAAPRLENPDSDEKDVLFVIHECMKHIKRESSLFLYYCFYDFYNETKTVARPQFIV
jgi:hypothetical protein